MSDKSSSVRDSKSNSDSAVPLFAVFHGNPTGPPPLSQTSVQYHGPNDDWQPSPKGTWADSHKWSEFDVFHAQLTCTTKSHTHTTNEEETEQKETIRLKIGKGGQLYSFFTKTLGEILPPQKPDASAWTDDTFITTLYGSQTMDQHCRLNDFGLHWLQNGYYLKQTMDPILVKPFYEPVMAEHFDSTENSYSMVNLRFTSMPSVHRSDVMMYTKFRYMGLGVLEVTYYFYNFSNAIVDALTLPWGGVRTSKLPDHIVAEPDGTYRNVKSEAVEMRRAATSGGWLGAAQNGDTPTSPAFALVHGVDPYFKTPGYEFMVGNTGTLCRIADTGPIRDFTVMAQWNRSNIRPGEGYYFRTYMVTGSLDHVAKVAFRLVPEVDYNRVCFKAKTARRMPLYVKKEKGQNFLTLTPPKHSGSRKATSTTPIGESYAVPVKGSFPLLLLQEVESGTYVITTDPYCVCSKKKFPNPFSTKDPKHEQYKNRVIYRPYDGRTKFVGLLGYVLPIDTTNTKVQTSYERLSEVFDRHHILFVPGERGRKRAHELLLYTPNAQPSPTNKPAKHKPPLFDQVQLERPRAPQGSPYHSTLADTAHGEEEDKNIVYTKVLGPAWLQVSQDGKLSGVPTLKDPGRNTFAIRAVDPQGRTDVAMLVIDVESNIGMHCIWNAPSREDWEFRFHVMGPSSEAYSDVSKGYATISVPTMESKGGKITNLCNGKGKGRGVSFPFRDPNRIQMDLGSVQAISAIHSFSHNKRPKEQKYDLYFSTAETPPEALKSVRSADLVEKGWERMIHVRTHVTHRPVNCQVAVNLRPRRGSVMMHARYLLWDFFGKGTTYVELDVFTSNDEVEKPSTPMVRGMPKLGIDSCSCDAVSDNDAESDHDGVVDGHDEEDIVATQAEDNHDFEDSDTESQGECNSNTEHDRKEVIFDEALSTAYWDSKKHCADKTFGEDENVKSRIEIAAEHNHPGTKEWTFDKIKGPSTSAYSSEKQGHATICVTTENLPQHGTPVEILCSGSGSKRAKGAAKAGQAIWFKENNPNRIMMDLGSVQSIGEVNSFSWNPSLTNHYYYLYYSDADVAPRASSEVRSLHLARQGWSLLAKVKTDFGERVKDSQIGTSVKNKEGCAPVLARYLLWDLGDGSISFSALDVHVV